MTREEKIERLIASEIDQMDFTQMYMYVWETMMKGIENKSDEQIDEMYNHNFKNEEKSKFTISSNPVL